MKDLSYTIMGFTNPNKNLEETKVHAKDAHGVIILSDVNDYKIRQK